MDVNVDVDGMGWGCGSTNEKEMLWGGSSWQFLMLMASWMESLAREFFIILLQKQMRALTKFPPSNPKHLGVFGEIVLPPGEEIHSSVQHNEREIKYNMTYNFPTSTPAMSLSSVSKDPQKRKAKWMTPDVCFVHAVLWLNGEIVLGWFQVPLNIYHIVKENSIVCIFSNSGTNRIIIYFAFLKE